MTSRQKKRAPQHLRDCIAGHMDLSIEVTPRLREYMKNMPPGRYEARIIRVHQEGPRIIETLDLPEAP